MTTAHRVTVGFLAKWDLVWSEFAGFQSVDRALLLVLVRNVSWGSASDRNLHQAQLFAVSAFAKVVQQITCRRSEFDGLPAAVDADD